jgi:hypothetical protein
MQEASWRMYGAHFAPISIAKLSESINSFSDLFLCIFSTSAYAQYIKFEIYNIIIFHRR